MKRTVSLLLAVVLLAACLPLSAGADEVAEKVKAIQVSFSGDYPRHLYEVEEPYKIAGLAEDYDASEEMSRPYHGSLMDETIKSFYAVDKTTQIKVENVGTDSSAFIRVHIIELALGQPNSGTINYPTGSDEDGNPIYDPSKEVPCEGVYIQGRKATPLCYSGSTFGVPTINGMEWRTYADVTPWTQFDNVEIKAGKSATFTLPPHTRPGIYRLYATLVCPDGSEDPRRWPTFYRSFYFKVDDELAGGPPEETVGDFTDVPAKEYYADPVKWAVEKEITAGTSATTFGPNDNCTRAQFVTFLWRAAGRPEPTSSNNPFVDVPEDYYTKAVLWAVEKEIVFGTDATHFKPADPVQRSQAVTFLYRYAGKPTVTGTNKFTDVTADDYFKDAVLWGEKNGVVYGTDNTHFSPTNTCVRAQTVTFLYRYLGK